NHLISIAYRRRQPQETSPVQNTCEKRGKSIVGGLGKATQTVGLLAGRAGHCQEESGASNSRAGSSSDRRLTIRKITRTCLERRRKPELISVFGTHRHLPQSARKLGVSPHGSS